MLHNVNPEKERKQQQKARPGKAFFNVEPGEGSLFPFKERSKDSTKKVKYGETFFQKWVDTGKQKEYTHEWLAKANSIRSRGDRI